MPEISTFLDYHLCPVELYSTRIWGAEKSTATVVTIVNVVKMIRQNLRRKALFKTWQQTAGSDLSITMAANFQSDSISFSLSIAFSLPVIKRSSWVKLEFSDNLLFPTFKMLFSSLDAELQELK